MLQILVFSVRIRPQILISDPQMHSARLRRKAAHAAKSPEYRVNFLVTRSAAVQCRVGSDGQAPLSHCSLRSEDERHERVIGQSTEPCKAWYIGLGFHGLIRPRWRRR